MIRVGSTKKIKMLFVPVPVNLYLIAFLNFVKAQKQYRRPSSHQFAAIVSAAVVFYLQNIRNLNYLCYYSLMNTCRKINTPEIEAKSGTYTLRKIKYRRNNSLPDLSTLAKECHQRSKEKLKYNKWYIKPDLRLKTSINSQPEFQESADRFTHYYESLYDTPPNFQNGCLFKKNHKSVRKSLAQQLCADLQNIRMLINFKTKKQSGRKRIPGVIDYFLKFKQREDAQEKKTYLKRKKIGS